MSKKNDILEQINKKQKPSAAAAFMNEYPDAPKDKQKKLTKEKDEGSDLIDKHLAGKTAPPKETVYVGYYIDKHVADRYRQLAEEIGGRGTMSILAEEALTFYLKAKGLYEKE